MTINPTAIVRSTLTVAVLASFAALSADHAESPGTTRDAAADIADVFVFPSPESASKLVMSMTFGGAPAPRARVDGSFYCDPNVLYSFFVDRANAAGAFDSVPELRINVRFGRNNGGVCGMQLENVPGAGGTFSGPVEQVIQTNTGFKAFAGLRNDPFFFDAQGLGALFGTFATPGQNGDLVTSFGIGTRARRDSFANRNVSAIVFDMSLEAVAPLTAGGARPQIRVWGTTSRLVL